MDTTLELPHDPVDDAHLLLRFLIILQRPEILEHRFEAHLPYQGLSNGWLITVWVAYILSPVPTTESLQSTPGSRNSSGPQWSSIG